MITCQAITHPVRAFVRILNAIMGLAMLLALSIPWLATGPGTSLRVVIANMGWGALLRGFGVRLAVSGTPHPGALFVANHVSWIDIAVLARRTGAGFVAKQEISNWPLLGSLARRWGCIMIDRNRRLAVRDVSGAITECLAQGSGLVIFPEGTTGNGIDLLPFHSSLLTVAGDLDGRMVQPVGIAYHSPDGLPLTPETCRRIAWFQEDNLLPHAFVLAARGGAFVSMWFGQPARFTCRKEAARYCRQVIGDWLIGNQAARLKRAA